MAEDLVEEHGSAPASLLVLAVMFGMLWALISKWKTPEMVVLLSLLVVWNTGIISDEEALAGFNNPSILVIGALLVAVKAIEGSQVTEKAARQILGTNTSFTIGLLRLLIFTLFLSAFLDSTSVVALLIPVAQDWSRIRGYPMGYILMPMSFVSACGGVLTTIGSGTSLIIQGLLNEAGKEDPGIRPFHRCDPGFIGLPLAISSIAYLVFATPWLVVLGSRERNGGLVDVSRDHPEDFVTEVEVTPEFQFVGHTAGEILGKLGLSEDTLLRLRRRRVPLHASKGDTSHSTASQDSTYSFGDTEGPMGRGWWLRRGLVREFSDAAAAVIKATRQMAHVASLGRRPTPTYAPLGDQSNYTSPDGLDGNEAELASSIEMAALASGAGNVRTPRDGLGKTWERGLHSGGADGPSDDTKAPEGVEETHGIQIDTTVAHDDQFDTIDRVGSRTEIKAGDVLVLSCSRELMTKFQGSIVRDDTRGLRVMGVSSRALPQHGTKFFELVLSRRSQLLGMSPTCEKLTSSTSGLDFCVVAYRFKKRAAGPRLRLSHSEGPPPGGDAGSVPPVAGHDALVARAMATTADAVFGRDGGLSPSKLPLVPDKNHVAIGWTGGASPAIDHPEGSPIAWKGQQNVGRPFKAGDMIVVLSKDDLAKRCPPFRSEFLAMRSVGCIPLAGSCMGYLPLAILAAMLGLVVVSRVSVVRMVFAAVAVLIVGGWIDAKLAVGHVDWAVLVLMGSALGLSRAIVKSGLAGFAGLAVRYLGSGRWTSLLLLLGWTTTCTGLVTSTAAAALAFPIALGMARELEASYKPYVMAVLIASSGSFLTPMATPSNAIVWKPGGYKFQDYVKLGAPLTVLYLLVAGALTPIVFPF